MNKAPNLAQLVLSLTTAEKRRALLFLQSPYHNAESKATVLFEALCKSPSADPAELHRAVYGKLAFQSLRLRRLGSVLHSLLEKWLSIETQSPTPLQQQRVVLEAYRTRGLVDLFERRLKTAEKALEAEPIHSPDWHLAQFRLQEAALAFGTVRDNPSPERLPLLDAALDQFWCLNKIKYACSWVSYRQLLPIQSEPMMLREALSMAQHHGWISDPSFAAWYHAWHCMEGEGEGHHFAPLHEALIHQRSYLPPDDLPALTLIAINYCIARINRGDAAQLPILFSLYQTGIETLALMPDGRLSPWTFKNIISAAIRLREFAWASQFANQYGPLLPSEYREGLLTYGRARIHFEQGQFSAARRLLLGIHIRELFTLMDARVLEMQACWEIGDTASLEALLDNFMRLLRRRKMLTYHKDNYLNFTRLLRLLMQLPPGIHQQRDTFRQEVERTETLTYRSWFLEKAR